MSQMASHGDVGPSWSVIKHQTCTELFAKGCLEDPERPAIIVETGLTLTRRELLERTEHFAGYLKEYLKPGDNVVVMLDNRVEFMIALFGIIACRATLVSIAPTAQIHDAGYIVRDSKPVLAIAGEAQKAVLDQIRSDAPSLKDILVVDGEEPDGLGRYERQGKRLSLLETDCKRNDFITVFYTSGTTGAPKGCVLDHGWWLRVLDLDQLLFPRSWQDRQLCCLPFYYADPAIQLMTSLTTRGTMVAMRRFSVSRFWDVVGKYDATDMLSIASIPALLLKGEPGPRERDHRMRGVVHAGLPKQLHREMVDRFGFHWYDNYGSTEGGIMARVPVGMAEELVGSGSIGIEAPDVKIRVVDDQDNDVPVGEIGEALIGGPDLFRCYLNRPDITAETMRGGWYHSGDLVRRDERGLLYFVGRKKDMIRRSGENIAAAEVEAVLRSNSQILEVAVVPVPDELRGEEVKAYILLKPDVKREDLPPEQIIEFCRTRLAAYKTPRYIEYRTEDFERTPSMRVQKQALLKERSDLIIGCWDRETGKAC
jgi:carnitine-CoA ligase